ncbi:hypothetical protein AB0C27_55855 [Nonomuraea sp. NPDC048882]|uniref:hypothetical protein n=1 Tax=Nonomuraea sp. NPDC048882 TaxID=3154347 RepID=UPI0033F1AF74
MFASTIKRVALSVFTAAAMSGALALGSAVLPAQAASANCSNNVYRVVWPHAGVYPRMSQAAAPLTTKQAGERVTGPTGWGHVYANGHHWTKVWVNSVPGWREGWMRDDAVTYIGCS